MLVPTGPTAPQVRTKLLSPAPLQNVIPVRATPRFQHPIEEMSVEDAALALEIPEATVRSRFFRARSLLRESLAPVMDDALADAFTFDGARCDRIVAGVMARARAEELQREE